MQIVNRDIYIFLLNIIKFFISHNRRYEDTCPIIGFSRNKFSNKLNSVIVDNIFINNNYILILYKNQFFIYLIQNNLFI